MFQMPENAFPLFVSLSRLPSFFCLPLFWEDLNEETEVVEVGCFEDFNWVE